MAAPITTFRGKYFFLSNFYPAEVTYKKWTFRTAEHAYQVCKCITAREANLIRNSQSPGEAKKLGKQVELRPDWEDVKMYHMSWILTHKFENPRLAKLLLSTGDRQLIEHNTWDDTFWGVYNDVGHNHLGSLLMGVREDIQQDQLFRD